MLLPVSFDIETEIRYLVEFHNKIVNFEMELYSHLNYETIINEFIQNQLNGEE